MKLSKNLQRLSLKKKACKENETIEEHDKHCDFCRGWKEGVPVFNKNLQQEIEIHFGNQRIIATWGEVIAYTLAKAKAGMLKEVKDIKMWEILRQAEMVCQTKEDIDYKTGYLNACDDIKKRLSTQSGGGKN